jgi:2,4-dienoyl-CoA reductase (NADPH2)
VDLGFLFSPIALGSVEVSNRIVMSAHGTRLASGGLPTEALMGYYEARARGGLGLIVVSTYAAHPQRDEGGLQPSLWSRDPASGQLHREMIERVTSHGTRMFAQIGYGGRQVSGEAVLRPVMAPSGVPWELGGEVPRTMTKRDITAMVRSYGTAAVRVRELGFEGVEIHGAHGYLIHEFLSQAANKRTDGYGGSFENRLRFLLEVIEAVRAGVGSDFPVGLRLSGDEFVWNGTSLDHQARVAARVASLGSIDYVSQTAGAYRSMERIVLPPAFGQGAHVEISRRLKGALGAVPLMAVGRIVEPEFADRLIGEGDADLVVMTRALIADPEMPAKARRGEVGAVRHCVGAMECWGRTRKNFAISCAVNPEAGREGLFPTPPSARPSIIAVVGAGPAGLEAAVRLADSGHAVVVFEAADHTGGRLDMARRATGLESWSRFIAYQRDEIARRPAIKVELGATATIEQLRDGAFAAVVVATGARPRRPEVLAASDGWSLDETLCRLDQAGARVAIYAESPQLPPLAVARTLAAMKRDVTLLTPHAQVGGALDPNTYNDVRRRLAAARVRLMTEVALVGVDGGNLTASDLWPSWPASVGEPTHTVPFDTLVYDVGEEPDDGLYHELAAGGVPVVRIGDCLTPRSVIGAMRDAAGVVTVLESRLSQTVGASR